MLRSWTLLFLAWATAANALDDAPVPPCASNLPLPQYSTNPEVPAIRAWGGVDWRPPPCVPWGADAYRFAVALAAEMKAENVDDILGRLGAISSTRGLKYWSVTEQAWKVLIEDAFALTGEVKGTKREDFSPAEMKAGGPLYFSEKDNRSSRAVIYRMRVLQADADRVIVDSANTEPIRSFGVTFFPPGSLHTFYEFHRRDDNRWGLYMLSAATHDASALVAIGRDSYVNRLAAAYGHLAKLPAPIRPVLQTPEH